MGRRARRLIRPREGNVVTLFLRPGYLSVRFSRSRLAGNWTASLFLHFPGLLKTLAQLLKLLRTYSFIKLVHISSNTRAVHSDLRVARTMSSDDTYAARRPHLQRAALQHALERLADPRRLHWCLTLTVEKLKLRTSSFTVALQ